MDFMKFFKSQTEETEKYGRLFNKLKKVYTDTSEDNLLKLSCIAGLFARVAYVDLHLDINEIKKMKELLSDWSRLDELETDKITQEGLAEIAGTISFLVKEGDEVEIGSSIAQIDESTEKPSASEAPSTEEADDTPAVTELAEAKEPEEKNPSSDAPSL